MPYFELSGTKGFETRIHWTEVQDIKANTSIVKITRIEIRNAQSGGFVSYLGGQISIGDKVVATMNSSVGSYQMKWRAAGEWVDMTIPNANALPWSSNIISHNPDGTGSVLISVKIKGNQTAHGSIDDSYTIELTRIPRESSLSLSHTIIDVGNTITANITRYSDDFKHVVKFYIDDKYCETYKDVDIEQHYMIPDEWYEAMPSSVSCTAYCDVTTYDGEIPIGNTIRKSFTVMVPSTIVPTIDAENISLIPAGIGVKDEVSNQYVNTVDGTNILVKGKNQLEVKVDGCSAGTGSAIASYTFYGPSLSKTVTTSVHEVSTSIPSVDTVGENLTYTITVTDGRGRSASASKTITCHDYFVPSFKSFNAYRANENGDAHVNGAYLKIDYEIQFAPVYGTNNAIITSHYNDSQPVTSDYNENMSGSAFINLDGDTDSTYRVYSIISDVYGGNGQSLIITVFGEARVLNIKANGTGIAMGKMAEDDNRFDCKWNAIFRNGITLDCDKDIKAKDTSQVDDITIYDGVNKKIHCAGIDGVGNNPIEIGRATCEELTCEKLTVSELSCGEETYITKTAICDLIYPVGSIYMSMDPTEPSMRFGGTWEKLQDKFLLAASDTYAAGSTGGEVEHVLTEKEMPSHKHSGIYYTNTANETKTIGLNSGNIGYKLSYTQNGGNGEDEIFTATAGEGVAHNNMPPYLAVYMWRRTK